MKSLLTISVFLLGIGLVSGCAETEEAPQAAAPRPAPPPGLTLPISINEVMVGPLDHAAHELWDVALDEKAPHSEDEWTEHEHHASQIVVLGRAIMLPGTGVGDALWVQGNEWERYAGELTDAGMMALDATRNRDLDALLAAGDAMVMTCEGCHAVYKPDIPSEGEFHPHYRR